MDDVALQAYIEGGGAGCQLFLHSGLWTNTVLDRGNISAAPPQAIHISINGETLKVLIGLGFLGSEFLVMQRWIRIEHFLVR